MNRTIHPAVFLVAFSMEVREYFPDCEHAICLGSCQLSIMMILLNTLCFSLVISSQGSYWPLSTGLPEYMLMRPVTTQRYHLLIFTLFVALQADQYFLLPTVL